MKKDILNDIGLDDIDNIFNDIFNQYNDVNLSEEETYSDIQEPDYDNLDSINFDDIAFDNAETVNATVITSIDKEAVKKAKIEERKKKSELKKKENKVSSSNEADTLNLSPNKKNDDKDTLNTNTETSSSDEMFESISRTDYGKKGYINQFKETNKNNYGNKQKKKTEPSSPVINKVQEDIKDNKEEEVIVESGEVEDDFVLTMKPTHNEDNIEGEEIEIASAVISSVVDTNKKVVKPNPNFKNDMEVPPGDTGTENKNGIFTSENTKVKSPVRPISPSQSSLNPEPITDNLERPNIKTPQRFTENNPQADNQNKAVPPQPIHSQPQFNEPQPIQPEQNVQYFTPDNSQNTEQNIYASNSDMINDGFIEENNREDTENNSDNNKKEKKASSLISIKIKKFAVTCVAIVLIIVLPVALTLISGKKTGKDKKNENKTTTEATTTASTEATTTTSAEYDTSSPFQQAGDYAYNSLDEYSTGTGGRFQTLDDLTLYISGEAMSCLSAEKQAETQFKNGDITYEQLKEVIDYNSDMADKLNHLLIANKNVYLNEGAEDKYNELTENINNLIVYGDTVLLNSTK